MLKITKATAKDSLLDEWQRVSLSHYGRQVDWQEKKFRFKAVEDGKLVGTIDGRHESGIIYISSLIVAKTRRRKGIGKQLVETAEDFGRKFGAHRTWLITGEDWNENGFYKKLGFKPIGKLPDFHFHKSFVIYTREIR